MIQGFIKFGGLKMFENRALDIFIVQKNKVSSISLKKLFQSLISPTLCDVILFTDWGTAKTGPDKAVFFEYFSYLTNNTVFIKILYCLQ